MDEAAKRRAQRRRPRAEQWPVRAYRLGEEPAALIENERATGRIKHMADVEQLRQLKGS